MPSRTLAARPGPAAQDGRDEPAAPPGPRLAASRATVVLALVPLAAALVHALGSWTSTGDNALITLRSLDVLTSNHPLLGTWTSASRSFGFDLNNPGPLQFDLLALPAKLLSGEGPAIGVVVVHALSIVGIFVVARRVAGPVAAAAAMLVSAALCWTLGSEVLVEPWQPHSLLLPFLLFLFLVWSTSCGDARSLPWLVGVGSLIVQTHVSYGILVPLLVAWAVLGLALAVRSRRGPAAAPDRPAPDLRRWVLVAVVVGALCWAQPLAEQLFGSGEGNLSRLARAATEEGAGPIGLGKATRLTGAVTGLPPWWLRPSFGQAWYVVAPENDLPGAGTGPPGLASATASLVVVGLVVAGALVVALRKGEHAAARAVATAALLLVLAVVTASRVPVGQFGTPPHQFRFLWPIAAFATFAVLATALRLLVRSRLAGAVVPAVAVTTAVVAVLAIPSSDQGVSNRVGAMEVIRDISPQFDDLEGEGPLIIDELFSRFGDPYGAAVLLELRARGIEFVTVQESLSRQLGEGRRADRAEARGELFMATGDPAREERPGARRVAFREGLSAEERRELAQLQDRVADDLSSRRDLPLTDDAAAYLELGASPLLERQLEAGTGLDGEALVRTRSIVALVLRGMVDVPDPERETLERYAELQHRSDLNTLAIYLAPVG